MKNRKTLMLLGFLAIVVLFVLAGCGQTATTTAPAAAPAAAPATASADKAPAAAPAKSLIQQWQDSYHAKYFSLRLALGSADAIQKAGYSDSCTRCHSAVVMLDDKNAKLVDFLPGGKYAGKDEGISCRVCHTSDGTTKGAWSLRNKGWDTCGSCHTAGGRPKVGGHISHDQIEMIEGLAPSGGTVALKDMPSFKYGMPNFSCQDCHITNSTKHDFLVPGDKTTHDTKQPLQPRISNELDYTAFQQVFAQEKCKTCHTNAADTANKVKQQQEEIEKRLEALSKINDEWSKKVTTMDKNDPKVKIYQEGDAYFAMVEADASKGVHNYEFAKELLDAADKVWAGLK